MKKLNNKGETFAPIFIFLFLALGGGHYQYSQGEWGKNGTKSVQNREYFTCNLSIGPCEVSDTMFKNY